MSEPYYCRGCGSPRNNETCPRCNVPTFIPAEGWDHPQLPDVNEIREAARKYGYAITEHGSRERDLDLVAVPWIESALFYPEFIHRLCRDIDAEIVGKMEVKPHTRIAVSIQKRGWYRVIDLSIICPLVTDNL